MKQSTRFQIISEIHEIVGSLNFIVKYKDHLYSCYSIISDYYVAAEIYDDERDLSALCDKNRTLNRITEV